MADNENDQTGATAKTSAASAAVNPGDWRVILLGVYLFLATITGLLFLGFLMTAETRDDAAATSAESQQTASTNDQTSPTKPNNSAAQNAAGQTNDKGDSAAANGADSAASPEDSGSRPAISIPNDVKVNVGGRKFQMTSDGYIFFIVMFAGMLGASVRCIFSFFRHLGVGDFAFGWTWYYLMLPPGGATLSLVIYFVIRGGFYSSTLGKGLALNLFSFAALAALTGLFSGNAMEKLKQVAEILLAPAETPAVEPSAKGSSNGGAG